MGIANYVTIARIILVPAFIITFYLPLYGMPLMATVLFSLAALTDWLDGYLARHFQQVSPLGIFLDPVADKLMVVSALILLISKANLPGLALPTVVIVCREIGISALREWMAKIGRAEAVRVSKLGKFKTMTQMFAVILLLTYQLDPNCQSILYIGYFLVYVAMLLTLWSMVQYVKNAWKTIYQL
jgi:CDP-diacylglycerol--glycerol-3-phosphate 3-phosphatidyltransferase